ncbi:MAG TPA: protein kinase [Candidatus Faecivicinus avistercoris]|nr:protein kinase [Candidatus Faecivicinus avistercoris]
MIGRVLSGRYVVEAVVGTGGMAVVYRAYDRVRKQTVALKVLRPEYESDVEFVRRFSREAEAASKVSHENIANLLDVGIDGDVRYIVMEFVDGQTLKEMIREQGRIKPDQALRMTIRILAAVDHAHRNGIVHRDIKPQNILVDRQGHVKVADFGIARLKTSQTTLVEGENGASALGSVHYFSPEQARGEVADEKSDLYSVGVVLYEMLTGQVPFDGETSVSVALKHVSEEPKSMRLYQSGISKALDEVVMRALCKDASKRYQTAAEMAADLRRTITHPRGGFVKYPQDPEEAERQREARKRKRQRDHRRLVKLALIAGVLLVLCVAMVVSWFFLVRNQTVVPFVVGMTQDDAIDALGAASLPASVDTAYSEEYEAGYVVSQSVAEGSRVREGTAVSIVVSVGSQWFYMDDYIGLMEDEALAALSTSGAKSVTADYIQSDEADGTVLAQTPAQGWQPKDTPVVLTVSGQSVRVPSLEGLTLEGAQALLEAEGLTLGAVTETDASDLPEHTVVEQSVPADSEVLAGTAVDLKISESEPSLYYPASPFTVAVPIDGLQVEITITMPSGGEAVAYSGELPAGTHQVDLSSSEPGEHVVRVYLDGVLMDSVEVTFD